MNIPMVGGPAAAGGHQPGGSVTVNPDLCKNVKCGKCGGEMEIISFIERDQRPVIERILRGHQSGAMVGGLWEGPIRTRANQRGPPSSSERDPSEPHELQLVLDPKFL